MTTKEWTEAEESSVAKLDLDSLAIAKGYLEDRIPGVPPLLLSQEMYDELSAEAGPGATSQQVYDLFMKKVSQDLLRLMLRMREDG